MVTRKLRFRDIGSYSGAGAGIAVFALYGFLPSSFLGGIVALNMVGAGAHPVAGLGVPGRFIVGLFMILSVVLTGFMAGFAGAVCGRGIGNAVDSFRLSGTPVTAPSNNVPGSRAGEKRQVPRATVSTVVRVEADGQKCVADMNDLSEKGARLSFLNGQCTHVESGQRLVCTLPGNVVKESRVVWKEHFRDECLVGIEFLDADNTGDPRTAVP